MHLRQRNPILFTRTSRGIKMKLLGKLYLSSNGDIYIHSRDDGLVYLVTVGGAWVVTWYKTPHRSWRLIGDSYAKD